MSEALDQSWVEVVDGPLGKAVVATRAIPSGTLVMRFEGPVVAYDDVPASEVRYVISFEPYRWIIPEPPARFINHSCEPNCAFRADRGVVTARAIARGEALTIPYDWADAVEMRAHPDHYFWDPRWTFECRCGSPRCRGKIDHYRAE